MVMEVSALSRNSQVQWSWNGNSGVNVDIDVNKCRVSFSIAGVQ